METKRCTECFTEYPDTEEYFCTRTETEYASTNVCEACKHLYASQRGEAYPPHGKLIRLDPEMGLTRAKKPKPNKEYSAAYLDRLSATDAGLRRCTNCKELFPATGDWFYQDKARGIGNRCKLCARLNSLKYAKDRPDKARVNNNKRRARKHSFPDNFNHIQWAACLDYWKHRCAVCGRPAGLWHTLAMDHWIPLASHDCPGTIPTNIVPLCHGIDGCNNHKLNHDPIEWLIEYLGPRKAKRKLAEIQAYFDSLKEHQ